MQTYYQQQSKVPTPVPPMYTLEDFVRDFKQLFSGFMTGIRTTGQVVPVATELITWQKGTFSGYNFTQLYSKCPALVVSDVKDGVLKYIGARRKPEYAESVEDVLRRFMWYSQEANNPVVLAVDAASTGAKILDLLTKLFGSTGKLEGITPQDPIKPYILAVLWAIMLTELSFHAMSSTMDSEIERMARFGVAITLGVITGVTGYFHSGGTVSGFKSPTSAIRTYYTTQRFIKDYKPIVYDKIPDVLKFSMPDAFDNILSSEKISAGKGLNMAYTFRVGDNFLLSIQGKGIIDEDVLKKVLGSIWPLVTSSESEKMYKLYTENAKLYSI